MTTTIYWNNPTVLPPILKIVCVLIEYSDKSREMTFGEIQLNQWHVYQSDWAETSFGKLKEDSKVIAWANYPNLENINF